MSPGLLLVRLAYGSTWGWTSPSTSVRRVESDRSGASGRRRARFLVRRRVSPPCTYERTEAGFICPLSNLLAALGRSQLRLKGRWTPGKRHRTHPLRGESDLAFRLNFFIVVRRWLLAQPPFAPPPLVSLVLMFPVMSDVPSTSLLEMLPSVSSFTDPKRVILGAVYTSRKFFTLRH